MAPMILISLAGVGIAGAGLYYEMHRSTSPVIPGAGQSLDPGMDTFTSAVVSKALSIETDTTILDQLASDLQSAGFKNSGNAVATRSKALKANIQKG